MENLRKILLHFKSEESLNNLSNKLFHGKDDYKLLPNMKEVFLRANSIDFTFKRSLKEKPSELKEWQKHWINLTPFESNDNEKFAKILFYFDNSFSTEKLSELLEQNITSRTNSINYKENIFTSSVRTRILGTRTKPQYPIYIISKGRSGTCITADHLIKMEVPFRIVIEEQEWNDYAKIYGEDILLKLDMNFKKEYDTYIENFDESRSKGSGPARNFVWHHSKNVLKSKFHWIFDDNILGFMYYNDDQRIKAVDGTIFAAAEDFINRYENIGIAGLNYAMFAVPGMKDRPYVPNTKIYSGLLIRNDLDFRWAGRYNEDVDICIRSLKEGYSTIQFDAFLSRKMGTQTMAGGNTEAFYAEEGTLPKSNMLMHNHPDITSVSWRFQRWHHITNYDIFDKYKDRTIGETIIDMMKAPILNDSDKNDQEIIKEIQSIDFNTLKKWNILNNISEPKRTEVIDVLKFYRYTKDNSRIIKILTAPKLLNCNYYDYIWGNEIPDTIDNKVMKDLLKLGESDQNMLTKAIDWRTYLSYLPEDKIIRISEEMERNKYLLKENIEFFDYGIQRIDITQEDHELNKDSRAWILNKYINKNDDLTVPVTHFDKRVLGEVKNDKSKKFKAKLTSRNENIVKDHNEYTILVHGSEDFSNEELFEKEMNKRIEISGAKEIINSVNYSVDLMGANYALNNKLKNKEFVPDEVLFGKNAYKKIYDQMCEYANECILFVQLDLNDDLNYLKRKFENSGKKITIISNNIKKSTLDDWD